MMNARAETVAEKPSFRQALQRRRCLILADGFYEWLTQGTHKTPMYIARNDHALFAFAGLWDTWRDADGTALSTCTIITTTANAVLAPIHQRMPVMLQPEAEAVWLDPRITAPEALQPLLVPYPSAPLQAYAVSPVVNSPRHNAPDCLAPV